MKKLFTASAALFLSLALFAQTQTKPDEIAKFTEENHNFGKIKHNVPVTYLFEFKNISDKPIVIENAHSSCGCTVPERPEEPIAPGASAQLKVVYNAATVGPINKEIFVKFAGVDIQKVLRISGEVVGEQSQVQPPPPPQQATKKEQQATKKVRPAGSTKL